MKPGMLSLLLLSTAAALLSLSSGIETWNDPTCVDPSSLCESYERLIKLIPKDNQKMKRSIPKECMTLKIARSLADLSFDLVRGLNSAKPSASNAVSPISVDLLLSMLLAGARGRTKIELRKRFGNVKNSCAVHNYLSRVLKPRNSTTFSNDQNVKIGNKIFVGNGIEVRPYFTNFTRRNGPKFEVGVETLDFGDDDAQQVLNKYVSDKTEGRVSSVNVNLNSDIKLLLLSAVHYDGVFAGYFEEKSGSFYRSPKSPKTIDFLEMTSAIRGYYRTDKFACLALPYLLSEFTAYFILPSEMSSLDELLGDFNAKRFEEIRKRIRQTEIALIAIPKFEIHSNNDLKPLLKDVLPSRANYDGIASGVSADRFQQVTTLKVYEKEMEKYEDGYPVLDKTLENGYRPSFEANRPFLVLWTDYTGTVYHAATFRGPEE